MDFFKPIYLPVVQSSEAKLQKISEKYSSAALVAIQA